MKGYCLIVTTAPDKEIAGKLAEGLLNERLAACVHMQDVNSCYVWEKKLCRDEETVLWIKTLDKHYDSIEAYILKHHPYDLPEIIKVPVTGGLPGYLQWVAATTSSGTSQ